MPVIDLSYARADALNLTGIADAVTSANSMTFGYSAANRLNSATGPWGTLTWSYDGVGNRTSEVATPPGGSAATDTYAYPGTSNRTATVTRGAQTLRSFGYDAAGNLISDSRLGSVYAYSYNNANRLKTVTYEGNLKGTYTYNGLEQLITRVITNSGANNGTVHTVHDRSGNVIAEANASGQTSREYVWLPGAGAAGTDLPLAVIDGVSGDSPVLYHVHADHLGRPIRMTDAVKATVWQAVWSPWGAPHAITGAASLDARFPGQWYQLEAGLHYNWHRHYDASIGRYTQPDPLGFVDGPSVYGYAKGSPLRFIDPDGRFLFVFVLGPSVGAALADLAVAGAATWWWQNQVEMARPPQPRPGVAEPAPAPIGQQVERDKPGTDFPPPPDRGGCTCQCWVKCGTGQGTYQSFASASGGPDRATCQVAYEQACRFGKVALAATGPHHDNGKCTDSRGRRYLAKGGSVGSAK